MRSSEDGENLGAATLCERNLTQEDTYGGKETSRVPDLSTKRHEQSGGLKKHLIKGESLRGRGGAERRKSRGALQRSNLNEKGKGGRHRPSRGVAARGVKLLIRPGDKTRGRKGHLPTRGSS